MNFFKTSVHTLFNRPSFHNPAVDGIRAIAVLLVIIGHSFFFQQKIFPDASIFGGFFRADLGVDLFFTISGFLIGSILFKEFLRTNYISFKSFYTRRLFRLLPVYLVAMVFGIFLLHNNEFWADGKNDVEYIWANILYVNNFINVKNQFMPWCWSLAIEEQFYMLIPGLLLLLLTSKTKKMNVLIYFLVLSSIIRFFVIFYYDLFPTDSRLWGVIESDAWYTTFSKLYDNLYTRYGGLLIGVIGAYLHINAHDKLKAFFDKKIALRLFYVSIAVFLLIFFSVDFLYFSELQSNGLMLIDQPLTTIERFFFAVTLALTRNLFSLATMFIALSVMLIKSNATKGLTAFLSSKFLYPIAQLSYSAYLMHEMIQIWLFPKLSAGLLQLVGGSEMLALILNGLIAFVLTFLSAFILYTFIERPSMEYRNSSVVKKFLSKKEVASHEKELAVS